MDRKYILFDLDGTLTDPKEGITKCVRYALEDAGISEPDLERLTCYIGPPLDESFRQFHKMNEAQALRAVEKYRERFQSVGIFENAVIEGIPACLQALQAAGKRLILATCKPEIFALRILKHYDLEQYFTIAVGSGLDGSRKHKNEVIEEVFVRLAKQSDQKISELKAASVMVGDRRQDIEGAHAARIAAVGVRFGYAEEGELEAAGADYFAASVAQLQELLLTEPTI